MRGIGREEAARQVHYGLLRVEISEILEEMVEDGEIERVPLEEVAPSEAGASADAARPMDPAEETWARFAAVLEATVAARRANVLPQPFRLGPLRLLRGAEFARHRDVDYSTVWGWRKSGRLPEASGGGTSRAPVFIPEDATVLDRDLARGHPAGLALVLHWYGHADSDVAQGRAIVRAVNDLPKDWTRTFFGIVAGWRERAREARVRPLSEEELRQREERRWEENRRLEPVPPLVNLRELRQERGLTQPALADRVGRSPANVSALERRAARGLGALRGAAEDLARALCVRPEDLWEPRGRPAGRYLSARAFAFARGVDPTTANAWLRNGRIPEAVPRRPGGNRLIPANATVVDADLAREYPGRVALLLHRHRHARAGDGSAAGTAERARVAAEARSTLTGAEAGAFREALRRWEVEGDPGPKEGIKRRGATHRSAVPPLVNLRAFREGSGLSRAVLAKQSGVSSTEIQRLEDPRRPVGNARRVTAEKLARPLGVPTEALWNTNATSLAERRPTGDDAASESARPGG